MPWVPQERLWAWPTDPLPWLGPSRPPVGIPWVLTALSTVPRGPWDPNPGGADGQGLPLSG